EHTEPPARLQEASGTSCGMRTQTLAVGFGRIERPTRRQNERPPVLHELCTGSRRERTNGRGRPKERHGNHTHAADLSVRPRPDRMDAPPFDMPASRRPAVQAESEPRGYRVGAAVRVAAELEPHLTAAGALPRSTDPTRESLGRALGRRAPR